VSRSFEHDAYPGRPRVLFVGLAESTHSHSWIDLLDKSELNVRLFGLPSGAPPRGWWAKTYLTAKPPCEADPIKRARLYTFGRTGWLIARGVSRYLLKNDTALEERWLAQVIRQWKPDVIHTLGLDPAGDFYYRVRTRYGLAGIGKWVIQLRGGSDLTLSRLDPVRAPAIGMVLKECDQLLSDNLCNFDFAHAMGVPDSRFSSLAPVPGTGGVDVAGLSATSVGLPSSRRAILWPKAYESPWSKALPVFEALRICWDRIQPCEVFMFAATPEVMQWYRTLPEQIHVGSHIEPRLPRSAVLEALSRSRVLLAPSLVDGTPNSIFEAMATGAFPIVSPLETITPIVRNETNVLFARNLYPDEIAGALVRAMKDDALVDQAARNNLELVRRIADRATIRPRVVEFYQQLGVSRQTTVRG
jgi:hypothetical protein